MYTTVGIPKNPPPRAQWTDAALGEIADAFKRGQAIQIPITKERPFVPTYHELRTAFEDSFWAREYKLRTRVTEEHCAGLDPRNPRPTGIILTAWFVKKV